jgi:hypothetical protein
MMKIFVLTFMKALFKTLKNMLKKEDQSESSDSDDTYDPISKLTPSKSDTVYKLTPAVNINEDAIDAPKSAEYQTL